MDVRAQPILLTGITVRMLAELAAHAGYTVVSLDYFGDADLRRLCPGISLLRDRTMGYSPELLVHNASGLDARHVVYSASLENHAQQVARLAEKRTLLGNTPQTLNKVRDIQELAAALTGADFCFPRTKAVGENAVPMQCDGLIERDVSIAGDEKWLWKPLRSGGGHGVQVWNGQAVSKEGVLQEKLDGMVGSAAFVANGKEAVVVGLTKQFVGKELFGASGFRYCGNIMPPPLPGNEQQTMLAEVRAIANLLTAEFNLQGLNGLDFIWHKALPGGDGRVWTLEVNPRPTAALELMETAYDLRLFDAHVQAFSGQRLPSFDLESALRAPSAGSGQAAAKAILFAEKDFTVGDTSFWFEHGIRDIPYPGDHIKKGNPICTVLATAATPERCEEKLAQKVAEIKTWLY